jgi:excisionase family DNA binding protein
VTVRGAFLQESSALLTLDDVAEHLQVSRRTVERLIAAGELAATRIGAATRVHPDDLRAFVERLRR